MIITNSKTDTCDHRVWRTGLPVRSAVLKPPIVQGQFSKRPRYRCRPKTADAMGPRAILHGVADGAFKGYDIVEQVLATKPPKGRELLIFN
ncbi:hypothetical protein N7474_010163 [Penicillium riverlandense]|uniref:uncharacterized protein n=1 Tax=Penicillium riverlandense TaxID=1903569 RepID=UPI0025489E0D|nr:uncharacterized protein N7474_010163 [Penicillium riverlandense]KAJ5808894.1 hypothetical protein N7474_010163 [Penicillium riverlandense]